MRKYPFGEVIRRMGANVIAKEVDDVFKTHPDVLDAKTVGLPHEVLGKAIVTVCMVLPERSQGLNEALMLWSRNKLSAPSSPDRIVLVRALPREAGGAVAIDEIQKLLSGDVARKLISAMANVAIFSEIEECSISSFVNESLFDGVYATIAIHWNRLLQAPEAHEVVGIKRSARIQHPPLCYSHIWGIDLYVFYTEAQKEELIYCRDEEVFVLNNLQLPRMAD